MNKKEELIIFLKSLPNEETRIFENTVVKYATNNSSIEDEQMVKEVIDSNEDEKIKYAAFYCLNAMFRRKKDFYQLKEIFTAYPQFKNHITYNHLWLMYQIEAELFYDYNEILKMAYELSQNINQHAGIVHILPATFASVCENCDEESKKELSITWFQKTLFAANRAIELEPEYAKFYCTKARVLAINDDFSEATLLIRRAIALEDSTRKDYALRVGSYQYYELLIKIQEQNYFFKKQLIKYHIINNDNKIDLIEKPLATKDEGPFIFISYAHLNSDKVFPIIQQMKDQGYRIWYDEGISFGTEYNEFIADKIVKASQFILFVSNDAVKSNYVRKEINFAIANQKEPYLIYLEETFLSEGMKMQFDNNQAIMWYLHNNEYLMNKIKETITPETNINYLHPVINVIESICEPGGNKPNEDMIYQDEYSLLVFDGSTMLNNLTNDNLDAVWYVNHFSQMFAKQDQCCDLKTILKRTITSMKQEVISKINTNFDFNNNMICASIAGIHIYQGKLEIYTLSDCTVIIHLKNNQTITYTLKGGLRILDQQVIDKMNSIHQEYNIDICDLRHNPEIKAMLIDNRLKMNKSDDYWTLAFDPKAIEYGTYELFDIKDIDTIIIHTDGFDLMDDLLLNKPSKSLKEIYHELRTIEKEDYLCNKYPRFKISDDATIVKIKFD